VLSLLKTQLPTREAWARLYFRHYRRSRAGRLALYHLHAAVRVNPVPGTLEQLAKDAGVSIATMSRVVQRLRELRLISTTNIGHGISFRYQMLRLPRRP